MSDVIERSWAAGLFEGEGCFSMNRKPNGALTMRSSMAMVDKDVLLTFARIIEVGSVHPKTVRGNRKPQWEWRTSTQKDTERVYYLLEPWLHRRRRDRYAELLKERRAYEEALPAIHAQRSLTAQQTRRRRRGEALSPLWRAEA